MNPPAIRIDWWSDFFRPLSLASLLSCSCAMAAAADARSDVFQPDIFGTDAALQRRTSALSDPQGRECELPSGGLALSTAVDVALCRNPSTRAAWASARQQAAALGSAESAWLPTISGTASEARTLAGDHIDATGLIVAGAQNSRDAAIDLTWTLYDFGGRTGRIRSARQLLAASAATLNYTAQQVVFSVVQGYYGVVAGDASLLAARTTEATTAHSLEIARALRTGGVATLADVLQAETAYDQATLARVQSFASAQAAHGQLSVVLGVPADRPLKLEPEPVPAEVAPLTARMADLMAEAERQRPDLAAASAQRDSAESDIMVARSSGRPSISFRAGRNQIETTGVANQNYGQIGVYLTVPIFTGFNVGYSVRQAQALLQAREADAEQIRLNVSLDVWNAYYSLDSANQQLGATAMLNKTAASNEEVALGRYQSGVGTIIDVLTAQTAAANARQLRINAELGWKVARAQLALALGRLTGSQPLAGEESLP